MRTKHVLMAMALPALFAACTSDEFVEQPTQGSLDGREVLGNLTVNVAGDADTRFDWSTAGWTFEDGDQFGAAVTDPTSLGTVENDKMLGNYIFSKNGNGYQTTSQMVEGTYLFYSYNQPESFVNKNTRDLIAFDLTTQTADLNDPEKAVSDNQLFISPLYFIEAENTTAENTIALPLRFIPYYSTAAFRIKNSTGAAFDISQIVLNGSFKAKGEIDPTKIKNEKMYYSVREGGDAYELTALDPQNTMTDAEVEKDYKAAYEDADLSKDATTQPVSSIVLNCNDYTLANGAEVVAYMQVPVGQQTDMTASIIVRVNGVSREIKVTESETPGTPNTTKSIASPGINNANFTRTATKAVFGKESDGSLKVLDVKSNNLQDAGGFYVDSNEELLEVLDRERGDINFYNTGDVEINDQIIRVLNQYTAGVVTFSNPIEIKVEDEDGLTLSSTVNAGINFKGAVTVNGNVGLGSYVKISDNPERGTNASYVPVTVESGKLTLSGVDVADANITVESGELVIAQEEIVTNSVTVESGTLRVTKNTNVRSDRIKALNFTPASQASTIAVFVEGAAGQNNSVFLNFNGVDVEFGGQTSLSVNEYASIAVDANTLTLSGDVENDGVIEARNTGSIENNGTITNYGTLTNITNNGFITMEDFFSSKLTLKSGSEGDGYIDNTEEINLSAGTGNNKVYKVYTGSPANINAEGTNIVVLNNTTVPANATFKKNNSAYTILLLGDNTLGARGATGTFEIDDAVNATLQIGLSGESDDNLDLARVVTGLSLANDKQIAAYNAGITTTNWAELTLNTLISYGGVNQNGGTIEATTKTDAGEWDGNTLQ